MNNFNVTVIDNKVPDELRQQVWEYLKDQVWHVSYRTRPGLDGVKFFVPRKDTYNFPAKSSQSIAGVQMPRTLLASDDVSLAANHPLINELWGHINLALGGDLEITGSPEGSAADRHPDWIATSSVPGLAPGWRVYTNAQPNEKIKRSHGVHRDNKDLSDETSMTILYVVNPVWYPTWFGECVYYSEDTAGETGDHQQFQSAVSSSQARDFNVGWPKQIVSPVPGRIIAYDSRNLHTTRPAAEWCTEMRIVVAFRARRKVS